MPKSEVACAARQARRRPAGLPDAVEGQIAEICRDLAAGEADAPAARAGRRSCALRLASGPAHRSDRTRTCQSCRTTPRSEVRTWRSLLYSMNPRSLNLFMKKLTRDRVVPTISARASGEIFDPLFGPSLIAVARQQQERPRQPLFTGVEEMIDKIGFDAEVPPACMR